MTLTKIFNPDYDSFRTNLDIIMRDEPELNEMLLEKLMRDKGFRKKRIIEFDRSLGREVKHYENLYTTESQINLAWEYVQSKAIKIEKIDTFKFRIEKYKRHTVRRSTSKEYIIYKNKKYRKGQFLPRDYK